MADDDFKPSRSPGDRIGNYVIVRLIGRGGLSEVYLAKNVVAAKRIVAIKVLARRFQQRPDLRRRLEREAEIYDALKHDNIVRMHDIGLLDDGTVYIVMDFIQGRTLREHLALGPLDLTGSLHVMIHVTSAMCLAHRKGIIHRDLKPENIMVTPDNGVKVLDFGIAKFTQAGDDSSDMPRLGTIGFLAPEQIKKEPVDGRADIYALGVIFYITLSGGRHPFEDEDGQTSDAEMLGRHLHAPPPLDELDDHCPPSLSLIVSKCLAKKPDDRYATMDELLVELSAVIHESVPPENPVAQRATEEMEIARVSGVQIVGGASEEPAQAQRKTEPNVGYTYTPPTYNRTAPPPRPQRGKGHTVPIPPPPEEPSQPGRVAVLPPASEPPPSKTAAELPPEDRETKPAAPGTPPNVRAPEAPALPAAAEAVLGGATGVEPTPPPATPVGPAFAPARRDLTPSASEADAPARRTTKGSQRMQSSPMKVQSAPVSNRSIVVMAVMTGLTLASLVATLPGFRAAVRRAPERTAVPAAVATAAPAGTAQDDSDSGEASAQPVASTASAVEVSAPADPPAPPVQRVAPAAPADVAAPVQTAPAPPVASPASAPPVPAARAASTSSTAVPRAATPTAVQMRAAAPAPTSAAPKAPPTSQPSAEPATSAAPAPTSHRIFGTEN